MKKWEDLTKPEKEKLDMYIKISNLWQPFYTVVTLAMFFGMFIAFPLIFTFYIPFIFAGMIIFVFVGVLALLLGLFLIQDKKRLYLMFGIESISKDVFDISNKDLRKLKRIYIWKKEK